MANQDVGPSKGAGRPSLLAMNPRNPQASAERRGKLLAAFRALDWSVQADVLELCETIAFAAGDARTERGDLREHIRQLYQLAGWEDGS